MKMKKQKTRMLILILPLCRYQNICCLCRATLFHEMFNFCLSNIFNDCNFVLKLKAFGKSENFKNYQKLIRLLLQ